MANAVYDPETEGEQRYHPPNLDPLDNKPAGDSSDPRAASKSPATEDSAESQSDLRDAENSGKLYNPGGDANAAGTSGLFNPGPSGTAGGGKGGLNQALKLAAKHKKGIGVGAGVVGGLAGIALMIFFMLIPLKIEHIVQNLEKRFFATSENAVDRETRKMFVGYMTKHVLPGYKGRCGTTIDKQCSPVGLTGDNPVTKMYRSWADARLENKLAENYGIEFRYDTQSKNWYMKAPGTNGGKGDKIGDVGQGLETDFQRRDRPELRAAVSDAFQHETRWKKVMYRYKVGRLLEEKYGLKRCIIYCGTRDAFADKLDAKKKAAKLKLVQRVITPRSDTLGTVMECLIQACDPTKTEPISAQDGSTSELSGSPENPQTDTKIRETNNNLAQRFAGATADQMLEDYDKISEKGYQRYLLEKILAKIGLKEIASNVADATPIIGWINQAAQTISFIDHIGPALKKLGYLANAASGVQLYMMYRTYADEIHTGHVDATETGSLTNSLSPGDRGTTADPQVGGTAGAEGTPLYASLIDGQSSSGGSSDYRCNDKKTVPAGKQVCAEEVYGAGNSKANQVHTVLHTRPLSAITDVSNTWTGTITSVFSAVGSVFGWIVGNIPGVSSLMNSVSSFIANIMQPFFNFLVNQLINNPWSTNMSGGRTFDMMAGGADVAGNDYAHTGLGGKRLTPQQVATIVNEQQDQARQSFDNQPFFARMFDANSDYSLVTKVAMSIPIGTQAQAQGLLADLMNPLSSIGHGFATLFSGRVVAAVTAQADPFGVNQYGYTDADLNQIGDPETYWNRHCSNNAADAYMKNNNWNKAAATSDANAADNPSGMPINTTTNPCLLIKAAVGTDGGYFDTSNLTADDLADQNSPGAVPSVVTGGGAAGGFTNPFPGGWVPNRLDMGYDGTFKGKIVAPFNGTVTYASSSFSNWGGYIEIKADDKPAGLPTATLYFAEGVAPIAGQQGKHVAAGTPIATAAASPYGNSYGQGAVGAIEWGLAQEGTQGSPTNTYVYGQCGSSAARQTVLNFSQWAQDKLGLKPPSETSNAGCP